MSEAIRRRFGPQAHRYATSASQSAGDSLTILAGWVGQRPDARALDVATGAGFTALTLAPVVREVVGTDLTEEMLAQARRLAAERGLSNVSFQTADATALPFPDASFDLVTSRFAPHHFTDLRAGVAEMVRVLKPGGQLIVLDTCSPEDPDLADLMNDIEVRRDHTHVRNLSPSAWRDLLTSLGLTIDRETLTHVDLEFDDWVVRGSTPPEQIAYLRPLFANPTPAMRDAWRIREENGHLDFAWDVLVIAATKSR